MPGSLTSKLASLRKKTTFNQLAVFTRHSALALVSLSTTDILSVDFHPAPAVIFMTSHSDPLSRAMAPINLLQIDLAQYIHMVGLHLTLQDSMYSRQPPQFKSTETHLFLATPTHFLSINVAE